MKLKMNLFKVGAVCGFVTVIVAGCSTPTIKMKMNVAGEVKLNDVSKIALADFNSLPGDPFTGKMAADKETCALVKRAVASSFYTSPMYHIVDMDIEKDINAEDSNVVPKKRYDAVIYGRLWWQITPETSGQYPQKFTLDTWENVPYQGKDPITKKSMPMIAKVMKQRRDVVEMLDYRVQNATLMLTLAIYRLERSGTLVKIVDTYQVSNQGFTLMNGDIKLDGGSVGIKDDNAITRLQATGKKEGDTRTAYEKMFVPKAPSLADAGAALADAGSALTSGLSGLGGALTSVADAKTPKEEKKPANSRKVDANGKLILTQDTVSMPTELQAKLMLASSISRNLSAKLAPTETTFEIPADLIGDERLKNLLLNGAYKSAKDYSMYMLRNKLGKQICEKLVRFLPEFGEKCTYPVPDSEKQLPDYNEALIDKLLEADFNIYFYVLGTAHDAAVALEGSAAYNDKMFAYLASQDLDSYFFALGLCCEAARDLDVAQEYYRFAFNVNPSLDYALGLSRVYLALGERARLKQTEKAKKAAEKKTKLD